VINEELKDHSQDLKRGQFPKKSFLMVIYLDNDFALPICCFYEIKAFLSVTYQFDIKVSAENFHGV